MLYAPFDGKGVESHLDIYNFWGMLGGVLDGIDGEFTIVGGDFNTDYCREGVFRDAMEEAIRENNMVIGDDRHKEKVTFTSKINGSKSWIDHFLVSKSISQRTVKVEVFEEVVGSDHQPLCITIHNDCQTGNRQRGAAEFVEISNRLIWKS